MENVKKKNKKLALLPHYQFWSSHFYFFANNSKIDYKFNVGIFFIYRDKFIEKK
jgi:hypothetical protein